MHTEKRLLSLDVLRGLTIAGMILVNNPGDWGHIYPPLAHAEWHGSTPTDWVFPFFLFMVGVAIPLALGRRKDEGLPLGSIYRKIILRVLIIFGIGLFMALFPGFSFRDKTSPLLSVHYWLMGGVMVAVFLREAWNQKAFQAKPYPELRRQVSYLALALALGMLVLGWHHYDLSTLRIPGVLQRIALVYGACGVLYLATGTRTQVGLAIGLLLGYWGLMTLVPVPDGNPPNLEPATNLGAWLDRLVLTPAHLWKQSKTWDPEGLLSTLPAIATGLSGMITGTWLRSNRTDTAKVAGILAVGAIMVALGQIWHPFFPINKKIWTSSYVLYTSGLALLFLGGIYWLVDIKGWKNWALPFQIYGMNAMFAFVLSGLFAKMLGFIKVGGGATDAPLSLGSWCYQQFFTSWITNPYNASLGYALSNVLLIWLACWALYRLRIFMKV